MDTIMLTPWLKFPDIPRFSIYWRMGTGEEYYIEFYQWFSDMKYKEQMLFMSENIEPEEWAGFYEMIISKPWPKET